MIIGLEAERANLPNPTGVERFASELIKHLAKIDQRNNYVLYFRTPPQDWFYQLPKNFKCKVMPFPKFWTQIRLSWEMFRNPVDVLVILASALPFYHPKNSISTVHDIAFEFFPDAFIPFMRNYLIWSTRFAVKHSRKVIAVSESTKKDLIKHYGAESAKIAAIHLGKSDEYGPLKYEQVQPVLDKYGLVYQKYVLFLGTMQPRKNISRLIDAFIKLKKENRIEETLAIAGGKGWLWEPIMKKIEDAGIGNGIKHLGYVDNEDLPALYSGSKLLTLPALYEGFGLPPLEAMASGVPVVVSNLSSMPEVVGDAGKLVDPNSVDSIAEGLLEVLNDDNLRKQMIEKGLEQAKKFSWENNAKEVLALIETLK